ncbi:unnamed protein product [Schistosoma rodhaini]|uniref:Uncharacterized protein n=1 Tax=Schistosoma rodhaini TaxID=6188 RepID=A0AA85FMH0_9TREM|nr:unnamed protein product [Schistosoma rodhaini]
MIINFISIHLYCYECISFNNIPLLFVYSLLIQRLFTVILEAYDLVNRNEKYLIDRAIHRGLLRPLISSRKSLNLSTDWHQVTISTQYSDYTFCIQLTCE